MTIFNRIAAIIVIASLAYLSFVLTLAEQFGEARAEYKKHTRFPIPFIYDVQTLIFLIQIPACFLVESIQTGSV